MTHLAEQPARAPASTSATETPTSTSTSVVKYVFVQDDPFLLPKLVDKYLREFSTSTAGINIQSVAQGKRTVMQTAMDLYKLYGFRYFQWKLRKYILLKIKAKIVNDILGSTRRCYSVRAVAKKYGVPITNGDVNAESFRDMLENKGVQFIVSISGTQFYKKALREQMPFGIINCHGALLPRYRGLMPSFWTLANGEKEGGVSVHLVNSKIDDGPIIVQKHYRIHSHDTVEDIMMRSKDLAAEAIIECVRLVEKGNPPMMPNLESESTDFSMPTRADVARLRANGHRLF